MLQFEKLYVFKGQYDPNRVWFYMQKNENKNISFIRMRSLPKQNAGLALTRATRALGYTAIWKPTSVAMFTLK